MSNICKTGLHALDDAFGGVRSGELTVIAGPSSRANSNVLAALERGLRTSVSSVRTSSPLDPDDLHRWTRLQPPGRHRAAFVDSLRMIRGVGPARDAWGFALSQLASELELALIGTWLTPDGPSNRAGCADIYNTVAEDPGLLLLVEERPGELEVDCIRMFDQGMPIARLRLSLTG